MQNAKNSLFLYLTPRQKSQLLGTLKSYAKKFDLGSEDLAYKFLEDEKYYLDINNPHFEFVGDYLEDDIFLKDLKKFFDYCQWEKRQKELMEPYLDKQKELAKIARKKALQKQGTFLVYSVSEEPSLSGEEVSSSCGASMSGLSKNCFAPEWMEPTRVSEAVTAFISSPFAWPAVISSVLLKSERVIAKTSAEGMLLRQIRRTSIHTVETEFSVS